jgi:hypothetical protein
MLRTVITEHVDILSAKHCIQCSEYKMVLSEQLGLFGIAFSLVLV